MSLMPKSESKKENRHSHILEILKSAPQKRTTKLALELGVSSETIRRDLDALDSLGKITRIYGGAMLSYRAEPGLSERLKLYISERNRIAAATVQMLDGIDSLFLGGGATTLHVARALLSIARPLTVLTASLGIALELAQNSYIDVITLPGRVEIFERMVCGTETVDYIHKYRAQISIIGASGIDAAGVSEALPSAAKVYEAMIRSSARTIVVADSSKANHRALRFILPWQERVNLVTNAPLDATLTNKLESAGATLTIAE